MKKILFLISVLCMFMSSCSDSPEKISVSRIQDLCSDEIKEMGQEKIYAYIAVGYFEENNKAIRDQFVKLKEAGIINYKVNRFAWYNKKTTTKRVHTHDKPVYYYGYYLYSEPVYSTKTVVDYDLEEHYIVTISLTEKGKKLKVDSIPEPKKKEKDLKKVTIDLTDYPEYNAKLTEHWPEIPYPVARKSDNTQKVSAEPSAAPVESAEEPSKPVAKRDANGDGPVNLKMAQAYLDARERIDFEQVRLYSGKLKVTDAYKISVSNSGQPTASAHVVLKVKDATPVGRIILNLYDGITLSYPVDFLYYQDKGWQISSGFDPSQVQPAEIEYKGKDGKVVATNNVSSEPSYEEVADSVAVDDYE